MEFLGFQVNSEENSARCLYSAEAADGLSEKSGKICWEDHCISESHLARPQLHYRTLQGMINLVVSPQETLRNLVTKFSMKLRITKEAETNLQWWVSLDRHIILEALLLSQTPNMIMESNASSTAWEVHQEEIRTGGDSY